jgi:hypothetical protein
MARDFQKELDEAERRFARSFAALRVAREELDRAAELCQDATHTIEALLQPLDLPDHTAVMVNTYAFWIDGDGELGWVALVHPSNLHHPIDDEDQGSGGQPS